MGSSSSSTKPTIPVDPANCRCRTSEYKWKWCECGRSKPSKEPPTKIRFWIDPEKIRKGERYNSLEIPEHAKTDKDRALERDPEYQALIKELQGYSKQIRDANK